MQDESIGQVVMAKFVFLASYPKSGNTWVRAFLTAVWRDGPVNINRLMVRNLSNREFLDSVLGISSSDLSPHEVATLRPKVNEFAARNNLSVNRLFFKTHDALLSPRSGIPHPIPLDEVDRILYIVRDPRDIAISLARHLGVSIDAAINAMADEDRWLSVYPQRTGHHVAQYLSSWNRHVRSWLDNKKVPLYVARYEDLSNNTRNSFAAILAFLGLEVSGTAFDSAISATQFSALQKQEECNGFLEKPREGYQFFHTGQPHAWESVLTEEQQLAIVKAHEPTMRRLRYLE
jgi:aryl sulfotransferase